MTGPNKAIGAGLGGAATIIVMWLIGLTGAVVPAEVASAITTVVTTGLTWVIPHGGDTA
jgi:hypothetical protein